MKTYSLKSKDRPDKPCFVQGYKLLNRRTFCTCVRWHVLCKELEAYKNCENCFGYGFAPIPWFEVVK